MPPAHVPMIRSAALDIVSSTCRPAGSDHAQHATSCTLDGWAWGECWESIQIVFQPKGRCRVVGQDVRTCQSKAAASATKTEAALLAATKGLCNVTALTAMRTMVVTSQNLTTSACKDGLMFSCSARWKLPPELTQEPDVKSRVTRCHMNMGQVLGSTRRTGRHWCNNCSAGASTQRLAGPGSARTLEPSITERQHPHACAGSTHSSGLRQPSPHRSVRAERQYKDGSSSLLTETLGLLRLRNALAVTARFWSTGHALTICSAHTDIGEQHVRTSAKQAYTEI